MVAHADVADIRYQAPASCPDETSFRARLVARQTGSAEPEVRVVVVERDGRYHGEVRFTGAVTPSTRELDAPDCEALVDAIAFLVALPANLAGEASVPSPPAPPTLPPTAAAASPDTTARPASRRATFGLAIGAGATTSSLVAPSLVVGPELFVELARARDGRDDVALLSPSVRLAGARLEGSTTSGATGAQATFTRWTGELSGCPVLLRAGTTIAASPCVGVRLGEIRGAASGIVNARSDGELSAAIDALARLRWSPHALPGLIEAEAGAELPFTRFSYRFLPDAPLFRTAAVGWVAGLALGIHFP